MTEINELIHQAMMRVFREWNDSIQKVLNDVLLEEGLTMEMLIIRAVPVPTNPSNQGIYNHTFAAYYRDKELLRWKAPVVIDGNDGKLTYQWSVYKTKDPS